MSSRYPSPYKEVGIQAQVINSVSKRRAAERRSEHHQDGLFAGVNDKGLTRHGHQWAPKSGRKSDHAKRPCRLCRKPWFIADGTPCTGKAPSRTP